MELDHIAIASRRISDTLGAYEALGLRVDHTEDVPGEGVRVAFLSLRGGGHLEILEPLGAASPIHKFLEKRGPGLHHVAFRVGGIETWMGAAKRSGLQLLSEKPKPGSRGTRVCFIHPKSAGGVLLELVEPPASVLDPRD